MRRLLALACAALLAACGGEEFSDLKQELADMTKDLPEDMRDMAKKFIPLQRLGAPEDVAAVISFLASEDSAYVSGAVIPVDGGMGMGH